MYTPPSVAGITFATGQGAQQELAPGSLCTLADAEVIQKIFGGTLINAAGDPALGTFEHLDAASANQPWVLIDSAGNWAFVGPRIAQMNGVATPGTWNGIGSGNPQFTPTPPPPPPPAPAPNSSGDAAAFLNVLTGGTPAASGGTGGLTPTEDATLNSVSVKLDKIIAWFHVQ